MDTHEQSVDLLWIKRDDTTGHAVVYGEALANPDWLSRSFMSSSSGKLVRNLTPDMKSSSAEHWILPSSLC